MCSTTAGKLDVFGKGLEPHAMLVNKRKARAAGVASYTFAEFSARGLRPRLPINLDLSNGDNGWIHPMFAEYTGWHKNSKLDIEELFLDASALNGMNRLRQVLQDRIDVSTVTSSEHTYVALLDVEKPSVAAAYGNPLLLASRIASAGHLEEDYEVVSLQEFMNLQVPSLFRAAALQVGSRLSRPEAADEIAHLLMGPAGLKVITPLLPGIAQVESAILKRLPHDFGFYSRLPHLNIVADSRLMTTLAVSLRSPQAGHTAPGVVSGTVYGAASDAFYGLAYYASREQTLFSVAEHAAPRFGLA